jgi:internalin A
LRFQPLPPEDDALNDSLLPNLRLSTLGSRLSTRIAFVLILALVCLGCEQPSGTPSGPSGEVRSATHDTSTPMDDRPTADSSTGPAAKADETTAPASDSDKPAETEDASANRAAQAISTPEQLTAALKEKNPAFSGQLQMEPISADLLALVINDPNLKDIRPLARQRIGLLDLSKCDLTDLSPLQGLPLTELYLEDNARLADITALRGMPLQKLYLSRTRVENLGPLRGAPLEDLNLLGARVKDLAPLAECPIKMLWLTGCPVEDISPLRRVPLVSLTLQDTRVSDLSPLEGHSLQRLHIGGTEVTDLTPLGSSQLTRLIFTPAKIKTGLDAVRKIATLQELGTRFDDSADDKMPPASFWELYDKGELK